MRHSRHRSKVKISDLLFVFERLPSVPFPKPLENVGFGIPDHRFCEFLRSQRALGRTAGAFGRELIDLPHLGRLLVARTRREPCGRRSMKWSESCKITLKRSLSEANTSTPSRPRRVRCTIWFLGRSYLMAGLAPFATARVPRLIN